MRKLVLLCITASSLSICTAQGHLHSPAASQPLFFPAAAAVPESTANVSRVYLDVAVTDASGKPVSNLKQSDFIILDNNHPQPIAVFHEISGGSLEATAHAVIVIDAINDTSLGALARQAKEVEAFFSGASGLLPYPVSIAVAGDEGFIATDPSRDRADLEQQVRQLTAGVRVVDCSTENATTSSDAAEAPMITEMNNNTLDQMEGLEGTRNGGCRRKHLDGSLAALQRVAKEQSDVAGRSVIVWVGPGWSPAALGKHADWFPRVVAATDALRDAQATLDFVSTEDYQRAKEFRHVNWAALEQGASSEKQGSAADLSLPALARQSGGLVFNESKDVSKGIEACLGGSDHYYLVAFDPSPTPAKDELHSVSVKVNSKGASVNAPTLYYGEQ